MGCAASSEAPTTASPSPPARRPPQRANPLSTVPSAEPASPAAHDANEATAAAAVGDCDFAAVASLSFHPDPELEASPSWSPCDGAGSDGEPNEATIARRRTTRHRSVSEVMSANARRDSNDERPAATTGTRSRTPAEESWRRQRLAAIAVAHGMTSDVQQFTADPVPQATVAASARMCAGWLERVDSVQSNTAHAGQ
uniref:Uncharacterized protein n=1 Tax=Neobodo designis TaxID=312471 RepID=A0A7S1L272_NEODS